MDTLELMIEILKALRCKAASVCGTMDDLGEYNDVLGSYYKGQADAYNECRTMLLVLKANKREVEKDE